MGEAQTPQARKKRSIYSMCGMAMPEMRCPTCRKLEVITADVEPFEGTRYYCVHCERTVKFEKGFPAA